MVLVNPTVDQRCHARNRAGKQCGHWPARGQRVCHMHGAKAPQNLAAAEERMRSLVHPAITALAQLIADNDLAAARYVLDYAGFKATEKVDQQVDQQITIRVVDETQPIILEQAYELNGRADD